MKWTVEELDPVLQLVVKALELEMTGGDASAAWRSAGLALMTLLLSEVL